MALEPQTTPAPREPRSAGAQPRPWQPATGSAQIDLVRRWQRLLRADTGQLRSADRAVRAVRRAQDRPL